MIRKEYTSIIPFLNGANDMVLICKLKRRLSAFIARIGYKSLLFILTPYGILNYIINAKRIFKCPMSLITNLFNPLWVLVFSTLVVRRIKMKTEEYFWCESLLNRLRFIAPDWSSLYIYFHIWLANDYEKIVKPMGKVVVDVGAHIGLFTLRVITTYRSNLVIAIEPNPKNLNLLYANILLNGVKDRVRVIKACAGRSKGKKRLFLHEESGRSSILPLSSNYITVDEVRLDEELNGIKIDFVKIDVDGGELEVIDGLRNKIKEDRPILVIEVSKQNLASILDYFERLGYKARFTAYGKENFHITALPLI
ncbi:MAG: FkbM family methyltransferase [Nitrososphaerota archaeon]